MTPRSPLRATLAQACAEPRTRQQLFDACGGQQGIGRRQFESLLANMLKAGELVRAGQVENPLHGQGRNNVAEVLVYQASATGAVNLLDLDAVKAAGLNSAEHSQRLLDEHHRAAPPIAKWCR
jgi:hypothetical protein